MASSIHNVELPLTPRPWWEVFIGGPSSSNSNSNSNQNSNLVEDLSTICNSMLAVGDDVNDLDVRRSKYAFIPSLIEAADGGSFNDPDSYLWSVVD